MWNCQNVERTVNDLYLYAKELNVPLLTDFSSTVDSLHDFWAEYNNNYEVLDWYFAKMFKNYRYFDQDISGDNPIEDVFEDFQMSVRGLLTIKDKSYTQLWKIQTDTNFPSPSSDYDITETRSASTTTEGEYVSGQRQDSSSETIGQKTNTDTSQVMAYNSSQFMDTAKNTSQYGGQSNSGTLTKGQQTNSEDRTETTTYQNRVHGSKRNPSEVLDSYIETWDNYSFYTVVFNDICKELLLV